MDPIFFWIIGILAFLFGTTYILKKTIKPMTYLGIISIIRTQKFNRYLDRIAKHERFLNAVADIGLIIGFGLLAIDYRYGRKKNPAKRIAILAVSAIGLYVLLEALSFVFPVINALFTSPFIKDFEIMLKALFVLFGLSGLIVGILAGYAVYILQNTLLGKKVCPGIAPIIPGVQIPKVPFVVPLHAWISFLLIMLLHEGMHGALARKAKITIKNTGLLLAGLLPIGAFVEPDEKQVKQKKPLEQLRFFSAGASANFLASLILPVIILLFTLFVATPLFGAWAQEIKINSVQAVIISGVDETIDVCGQLYPNPAFGVLEPGMQIKAIGDYNIISENGAYTALGYELGKKPNGPIIFQLLDASKNPVTKSIVPNELGIMRFTAEEIPNPNYIVPESYKIFSMASELISGFLTWLILLNFFIAITNFLPTDPLDGGKIAKVLLLPYFGFLHMNKKDTEKFIGRLLLWIIGILIILNALPLLL